MRRIRSGMHALKSNKKKGAALVIAIIIMLLLTMLSLVLLTVSYSLHRTAYRQRNMEQCKEIAQGLSKELQAELRAVDNQKFQTIDDVRAELNNEHPEYPLWSYLRCNLWQNDWPYYNDSEPGHQFQIARREFTLDYENKAEGEEIPGDVTVAMYWEGDHDTTKDKGATVYFYIQVTCQIGDQKSTITSEYDLNIAVGENERYTVSEGNRMFTPIGSCNPHGYVIDLAERWYFTPSEGIGGNDEK